MIIYDCHFRKIATVSHFRLVWLNPSLILEWLRWFNQGLHITYRWNEEINIRFIKLDKYICKYELCIRQLEINKFVNRHRPKQWQCYMMMVTRWQHGDTRLNGHIPTETWWCCPVSIILGQFNELSRSDRWYAHTYAVLIPWRETFFEYSKTDDNVFEYGENYLVSGVTCCLGWNITLIHSTAHSTIGPTHQVPWHVKVRNHHHHQCVFYPPVF